MNEKLVWFANRIWEVEMNPIISFSPTLNGVTHSVESVSWVGIHIYWSKDDLFAVSIRSSTRTHTTCQEVETPTMMNILPPACSQPWLHVPCSCVLWIGLLQWSNCSRVSDSPWQSVLKTLHRVFWSTNLLIYNTLKYKARKYEHCGCCSVYILHLLAWPVAPYVNLVGYRDNPICES